MILVRFLVLSGLSSALFWLGYFLWWPAIILAPVALALSFVTCRRAWTCVPAALAGGMIAGRAVQDCLTAYGPFGVYILLLWQAVTLIPVALSLRWGWRRGLGMVWLFPLVWVGGEYLRMLGPLGFPFCALAVPTHDQLWLIQIADLGGLHLVSAVLAMISGLLLDLARHGLPRNRPAWKPLYPAFGGVALVLALVVAYGVFRRAQIERDLRPGPVIAVIQPDVPYTSTPESDYDGRQLLRELQAMSEAAARHQPRPQLIVWPEALGILPLENPEYFEQPFAPSLFPEIAASGSTLPPEELSRRWDARRAELRREDAAMRAWVRKLGIPLLFGELAQLPSTQDGQPVFQRYNSARLLRPGGTDQIERQHKVRSFPGGEYIPGGRQRYRLLEQVSPAFSHWLDSIPDLQPGQRRELFSLERPGAAAAAPVPTAAPTFFISICSEILFPQTTGVFDFREAEPFHVSIASEGRYQRNRSQLMTYMIQPFRAIEARTALARCANTGISGFVSATGQHYGQVTNAAGQLRSNLGYLEKDAIEAFRQRARAFAGAPSDPVLQAERAGLQHEIQRLRAGAGVAGFSVARLDGSPHRTVYQATGDLFAQAALLGLLAATLAACRPANNQPPVEMVRKP